MAFEALPKLSEVIRAAGLQADKRFGQNFLLDLNVTRKIVRQADIGENALVVEIGPGPGGLTRALLETGAVVDAYELDPRVKPILDELSDAADGCLRVHMQDALDVDWSLMADGTHIVANLPYNIATPLIVGWLALSWAAPAKIASMSLMVQEEVAGRLAAQPGTKAYGRLSVMAQWLMDVKTIVKLPPSAFTPPPKVHSAVVRFTPKARLAADWSRMEKVVAAAFNQRRKMIRTSLGAYGFDWEKLNIDPQKRAENLTVADYVALSIAAST